MRLLNQYVRHGSLNHETRWNRSRGKLYGYYRIRAKTFTKSTKVYHRMNVRPLIYQRDYRWRSWTFQWVIHIEREKAEKYIVSIWYGWMKYNSGLEIHCIGSNIFNITSWYSLDCTTYLRVLGRHVVTFRLHERSKMPLVVLRQSLL